MYSRKAVGSNDPSLGLLGRQKNAGTSSVNGYTGTNDTAYMRYGSVMTDMNTHDTINPGAVIM